MSDASSELSAASAAALAQAMTEVMQHAHESLSGGNPSATARLLTDHLGVPVNEAVHVSSTIPEWQHVSLQRGIDAYLAERGDAGARWVGITARHRNHMDLASLLDLQMQSGRDKVVPAEYKAAADGPASTTDVVSFGLLPTTAPGGEPVVIVLRVSEMHGPSQLALDVLGTDQRAATAASSRVRELAETHDVIRGQVVSFGTSEHYGNAMVSFLPRPDVQAGDIVLPENVLAGVVEHVIGTGRHADALRRSGIHLKRGLLLHGPPGTGKTHTVRHLIAQATDSTVIILSGTSVQYIEQAAAIARRLSPSVVVVEDVDLIGRDRSFSPNGNPLLFTLLDAMDGVAADADVTFLLTTNRPSELEQALVERPGRIDLAVEIPLPDADGRLTLLELYAGAARVAADLGPAVEATAGMTASAMKELMRRCVLAAIEADSGSAADAGDDSAADPATNAQPVITEAILAAVVDKFTADAQALSRALVGGGGVDDQLLDDDDGVARPGVHPGSDTTFARTISAKFHE